MKYAKYLELALTIILPLIGVFFYQWSIGDVYALFFLELIFYGIFAGFKVLFSTNSAKIGQRLYSLFIFGFIYFLLFFSIVVLTGHFFNGAGQEMNLTIGMGAIYVLATNHLINLLIFIFSRDYRQANHYQIIRLTYKRAFVLFLVLLILMLPFSTFIDTTKVNFVLVFGLIVSKAILDFITVHYWKKAKTITN